MPVANTLKTTTFLLRKPKFRFQGVPLWHKILKYPQNINYLDLAAHNIGQNGTYFPGTILKFSEYIQ